MSDTERKPELPGDPETSDAITTDEDIIRFSLITRQSL